MEKVLEESAAKIKAIVERQNTRISTKYGQPGANSNKTNAIGKKLASVDSTAEMGSQASELQDLL